MSDSSQQSGRQKLKKEELYSTRFGVMHLKNVDFPERTSKRT